MRFNKKSLYKRQKGFSLMEAILVSAVMLIAIAGIYRFYQSVNAAEVAHHESQNIVQLTDNIVKTYSSNANFNDVSNSNLILEGAVPNGMEVANNKIVAGFGGDVVVRPATISGESGRGFSITYTSVPKKLCSELISTVTGMQKFSSVVVGGSRGDTQSAGTQSATSTQATGQNLLNDGQLDRAQLADACSSGSNLQVSFTYQRGEIGTALSDLDVCTLPTPDRRERTLNCPTGYLGNIVEESYARCADYYGLPFWEDWVEISNTCEIECKPEPNSPDTKIVACPTGYSGEIIEQRVSTCAAPTGYPTWSEFQVVSDTCEKNCVAPSPEQRPVACPSGYTGSIIEERIATCPNITGAHVWGPWKEKTNTCEKICVVPSPGTENRWVPANGSCPAGYSGVMTWEEEERRVASCPQYTGNHQWSSWSKTGNKRNENTSQCVSLCKPETTLQRWVDVTGTCPAGYVGNKTWQKEQKRTSVCTPPAVQPKTSAWADTGVTRNTVDNCRPASCVVPSSGIPKTWTVGSLTCSAFIPGGTYSSGTYASAIDNLLPVTGMAQYQCINGSLKTNPIAGATCVGNCESKPSVNTRTYAGCGAGKYGAWQQSQDWNKAAYPTCWTEASWAPSSAPSGVCKSCPANTTDRATRWVSGGENCPSGQYGSRGWEAEQERSRSESYSCPAGTATKPSPTYGTWSSWKNTGTRRNNTGGCTNCPANKTHTEKRWVSTSGSCPANQYGSKGWEREQQRTREERYSCPAGTITRPDPTWTAWTSWANTGNTRNSTSTCKNCPAKEVQKRWVSTSNASCSANQYGYISREKEQSRDKTYNCPAGTTTLPSPNYTSWKDTGSVKNTGSTCKNCPADSISATEHRWNGTYTQNCSTNQYGIITRERQQERKQTRSYDCSSSPTTLPTPTYTWTGWYNNGETRLKSNTCKSCPTLSDQVQTEYNQQYNSYNCPAGQYGYNKRERERTRSRTRKYVCPAGTTTLPDITYGAWSSWTNTGNTRDMPGTNCSNCPGETNTGEKEWRWYGTYTQNCPSGQTGIITRERQQERHQKKYYDCPAGTRSLPAAKYKWGSWFNNGTTRLVSNTCKAACQPGTEYKTWENCTDRGQTVASPGSQKRTWTCNSNGTKNYSAWQIVTYPQCCPAGRICQIQ